MTASRRRYKGDAAAQQARRHEILAAAYRLFVERGFRRTTMAEVARRARCSKETLYAWFGSKEKLLGAMIAWHADQVALPASMSAPPPAEDAADVAATLTGFLDALTRLFGQPGTLEVYRIIVAEGRSQPELGRLLDATGRRRFRDALVAYLRHCQAAGILQFDDAAAAARDLLGLAIGQSTLLRLLGLPDAPDAALQEARNARAVHLFLRLAASPPPRPGG